MALSAAVLAAAPAASAHPSPARGDVVQLIRLTRRYVQLPDVPGWHYHRSSGEGFKGVTIQPLDAKTGKHGYPSYFVKAMERGLYAPEAWLDLRHSLRSKVWADGWAAYGGLRCPWFDSSKAGGKDGPRIRLVYITYGGVAAELWYDAGNPAGFKAGLPAFERFAAGVRIR